MFDSADNLWTQKQTYNIDSRATQTLCPVSVVVSNGGPGTRREAQSTNLPLVYLPKFEQPVIYGFPKMGAACQLSFLIAVSQPILHEFI